MKIGCDLPDYPHAIHVDGRSYTIEFRVRLILSKKRVSASGLFRRQGKQSIYFRHPLRTVERINDTVTPGMLVWGKVPCDVVLR